jgi:hypothetical protein
VLSRSAIEKNKISSDYWKCPHPPFSPDLMPRDFHFPESPKNHEGNNFHHDDEVTA